jgi:TonB family protein
MTQQLWLGNLGAFSLQVAILVVAGSALVRIFRLKAPAVLLTFWQALLVACLLLPAFQPWRQVRQTPPAAMQTARPLASLPVFDEPDFQFTMPAYVSVHPAGYPLSAVIPLVLAGGAALRLLWLLLGLVRLQRYVDRSRRPAALPESIRAMQRRVGVAPEIFISPDIDSPITVGWRRPAVLLPESFTAMNAAMQRTIVCHEFLHVERGDWLFIVFEELLRSLFWFHPAIWWALGRIHLSREQVVDRQVLRVTGERGPYLESLLHIASLRGRPVAVPAPLLLREHHLVQRVALMLKESKMTRPRLVASLAAIAALLLWTGTHAVAWFPLTAPAGAAREALAPAVSSPPVPAPIPSGLPAQPAAAPPTAAGKPAPGLPPQEPMRVGGNVQAAKLIYKVDPVYPDLARRARVQQTEILEVLVDAQGAVASVRVIQGHPLLDQPAIEAVRQWRYSPTVLKGEAVPVIATVAVPFVLSSDSAVLAGSNTVAGVLGGAPAPTAGQGGVIGGAPSDAANAAVAPPQKVPLRVGGNVQETKILKRVDPVYPELAKQARVEQIVMLEVTVNEEGYVSNARVIRGHPLLDQAAIDAVKQWVYAPTLLNDEKVPVVATVTVIFSLSQRYTLDADGYIKDPSGAIVPVTTLRETQGSIQITPSAQTSFEQVQQTFGYLQSQGIENVRLNSQAYTFAAGRLFYLAPAAITVPVPASSGIFVAPVEVPRTAEQVAQFIRPPVLDIDWNQLAKLAEAGLPPMNSGVAFESAGLNYTVCVDEAGQIVAVQGPPRGSLDLPEVTAALRAARVTRVGSRGNFAVPVALRISLRVTRR